jgi:transcriptional regulator with PAS, ATPase and Fis domain
MRKVYEKILRSAVTDAPVMIYGETGTGKELTARMIFEKSDNHTACFLPVNCASIPDHLFESQFFGHRKGSFTGAEFNYSGYFEQAKGGTLFLDEIGELPLPMQAKLLRILEDHNYSPVGGRETLQADVRIITATNQNLHDLERQGKFRSDFFYRLHVLAINLPPLRARKEDLPLLIAHFFKLQEKDGRLQQPCNLSPSLLQTFNNYNWPGNVRELFNELERFQVNGEVQLHGDLTAGNIPHEEITFLEGDMSLVEAVARFEHFYIHKKLEQHLGQKNKTAAALKVDRKTLYSKLRKHSARFH